MLTICDYNTCSSHVTSRYVLAKCVAFYTNINVSMDLTKLEVIKMARQMKYERNNHAAAEQAELELAKTVAQWRNILIRAL